MDIHQGSALTPHPPSSQAVSTVSLWRTLFVLAAVLLGFFIRAEYVSMGFQSLTSDEVWCYHDVQFLSLPQSDAAQPDLLPNPSIQIGSRRWILQASYLLSGYNLNFIPFFVCLINVMLYLFWAYVLIRRTGCRAAGIPVLAFLALPPPCIYYLGTQISETRSFYWFGALLVLFAGYWMKDLFRAFLFGLLAVWACLEDPFSVFFLIPVLWYEKDAWKDRAAEMARTRLPALLLGGASAAAVSSGNLPWTALYRSGYVNPSLGSWAQIQQHAALLFQAWPQYWFGRLPWGYLQNSTLGRLMNPPVLNWPDWVVGLVFWVLLAFTLAAAFKGILGKMEKREILLWFLPPALFLAFFVFGNQAWDALTLRYIGFWQYFIPILLGLAAAQAGKSILRGPWVWVLGLWLLVQTLFLVAQWIGPERPNPGRLLAERVEQAGYHAGYCNYWASELIRYYSQDRVLMAPYNHLPISRRVTETVQTSPKVALVWVEGLDHSDKFPEVANQLAVMGYHPTQKIEFKQEGWSILGWEKQPSKPAKGRL
jgi:hypothetical protein